jgi:hypothetical protein
VRGATDLLENGCQVTVDGVSGTVTPARPEADAG